MQIAILAVLVVIALIMAPWLIGLIGIAAVGYGAYLMVALALSGLAAVAALLWFMVAPMNDQEQPREISGERKPCPNCQVEVSVNGRWCPDCGAPL